MDINAIINERKQARDNLIGTLLEVQRKVGYIPDSVISPLADAFSASEADVVGVISFYSDFRRTPPGEHVVRICSGDSCFAAGSTQVLKAACEQLQVAVGETTSDNKFSLGEVYCLGNCALSPSMMIDEETYGKLSPDNFMTMLGEAVNGGK